MKSKLLLTILLLAAQAVATTVTGKALDPNSFPYTGTISGYLLTSGPPKVGGVVINTSTGNISLGVDGSFAFTVVDTSTITPSGSVWQFTVCGPSVTIAPYNQAQTVCFTASPIAVTGATQDITSTLATSALTLGPANFWRTLNNNWTGLNTFRNANNIRYADAFGSANDNGGAKILLAQADLGGASGVIDARGFLIDQVFTSNIQLGNVNQCVTLYMASGISLASTNGSTIHVSGCSRLLSTDRTGRGAGLAGISISGLAAGTDGVTLDFPLGGTNNNLTSQEFAGFYVSCNLTGRDCVRVRGGRGWRVHDLVVTGGGQDGIVFGGLVASEWSEQFKIENVLSWRNGRHNCRFDNSAANGIYLNDGAVDNLICLNAGVSQAGNNLIFILGSDASVGIGKIGFRGYHGEQTLGTASPDGVLFTGPGGSKADRIYFEGGEIESQGVVTGGFSIKAAAAGLVSGLETRHMFLDPDYTGGFVDTTNIPNWVNNDPSGIGAYSGAMSFPAFTVRGNVNVGTNSFIGNNFTFQNDNTFLNSPADGVITLFNAAGTNFGRLIFGGTSSLFPALKRNSIGIDVRLADDSAYGNLAAAVLNATTGLVIGAGNQVGSVSGNSGKVAQSSGAFTSGNAIKSDASGNIIDAGGVGTLTIASGTATLGTTIINAGTCAAAVTVAAAGATTADSIIWAFTVDPSTIGGYGAGGLSVWVYPTSGNVNVRICNPFGINLTPAAATLNWRVTR